MNIIDIIARKRDGKELTTDEINFFIKDYTNNNIEDYQAAALVMAIYIKGMSYRETKDLTMAMASSGDVLDLSELGENVVDKHSTGGVGDKVTIILAPLIASLDIPVAKMSGRGLGYTGGTADKIEAIPGYNTGISEKEFIDNVKSIGISLITQTLNLAPADKKIYALRDTIACTESIPLIASSIMSKKIASGANKIVLDVTCGFGAFMKNIEDARELSKTMIEIGNLANRETVCVITNMNEPLGFAVGNSLEIIEAIEFLQGKMPEDLKQVILKDKEEIQVRPGLLLEPVDFEQVKTELAEKTKKSSLSENDVIAYTLYPKVFLDYMKKQDMFGDLSKLDTPTFFYGMNLHEELEIEIEEGKTLIVKLLTITDADEKGYRSIYFEMNGQQRVVLVKDESIKVVDISRMRADSTNPEHIGATMPGTVLKVLSNVGDVVKRGEHIMVTEAMKMETTVQAPFHCKIKAVHVKAGEQITPGDLLVEIEKV